MCLKEQKSFMGFCYDKSHPGRCEPDLNFLNNDTAVAECVTNSVTGAGLEYCDVYACMVDHMTQCPMKDLWFCLMGDAFGCQREMVERAKARDLICRN